MPGFSYFVPESYKTLIRSSRLRHDWLVRFDPLLAAAIADCDQVPDDCVVTVATIDEVTGSWLTPKSLHGSEPLEWTYNPAIHSIGNPVITHPADPPLPLASPGECLTSAPTTPGASLRIGWETERPPRPEDLCRKTQVGGAVVEDKLGQIWRIPIARSPRGRSQLPCEYIRMPGAIHRRIDPAYLDLWSLAGQIRDWLHDQYSPDNRELWAYDAALQVLSTNYRIGPAEANLLQSLGRGVLTSATIEPILVACVDWDLPKRLIDALEKKTETAVDS
jgi:hypothetical protein